MELEKKVAVIIERKKKELYRLIYTIATKNEWKSIKANLNMGCIDIIRTITPYKFHTILIIWLVERDVMWMLIGGLGNHVGADW